MSKNQKVVLFIGIGITAIVCLIIGSFFTMRTIYVLGAKVYLANKYSWNIKDIETLDFCGPDLTYSFDLEGGSGWYFFNPTFEFEYKGKKFYTEYMQFAYDEFRPEEKPHFADDYQLEDIFNWCTEYLQENVDKDIAGVEVSSEIIYHSTQYEYNYELPWDNNREFTKNDAEKLLEYQSDFGGLTVFYMTNDLNKYGSKPEDSSFHRYTPNAEFSEFLNNKRALFNSKPYLEKVSFTILEKDEKYVYTQNGFNNRYAHSCFSVNKNKIKYIN